MSLRGFHIVFITICTLLCVFLMGWAFLWEQEANLLTSILGFSGIAGLLMIPFYAVYFLKKSSRLN